MAVINGTDNGEPLQGTPDADTIDAMGGNDVVRAYAGDDTVYGGAGNDTLYGYEGADTLYGGIGDDLIFTGRPDLQGVPGGQFGSDVADGGDGVDTIVITWFNQQINGQYASITLDFGNGNFVVHGAGSDWETASNFEVLVYYGADGGDTITASGSADFIQLGYGNDVLKTLGGDDHIVDLGGVFNIDGGTGIDTLELPTYLGSQGVTLRLQPNGTALLGGGYSGSIINVEILSWDFHGGTPFNDDYAGGIYADEIHAGGGNDHIEGGDGNDKLFGGRGDDTIYGGEGNDDIEGGGFQEAEGFAGADTIHGGNGDDSIQVDDNTGALSHLYGEDGNDSVSGNGHLEGGAGNDHLGGSGQLYGGTGDDTIFGFAGSLVDGGDGSDTLDYRRGSNTGGEGPGGTVIAPLIVDLEHPEQNTFGAAGTTFVSMENIIGSLDGPNDLRGDEGANTLTGGLDEINWLKGRGGNDTLIGDSRPDILDGGTGADTMQGGTGNDTYYVDDAGDVVDETVNLFNGGIDTVYSSLNIDLSDAVHFKGKVEAAVLSGPGDLTMSGNGLDNTLSGNAGANPIDGRAGADVMRGLGGNDTYVVDNAGDVVDESVAGSGGTDTVRSALVSINLGDTVHYKGALENILLTGSAGLAATGNASANVLDGSANTAGNLLRGMGGNDVYLIGAGDIVDESVAGSGGGDSVRSSLVSINLGDTVHYKGTLENILLTGTANLAATGNAVANAITGNAGANTLNGGIGHDRLLGAAGRDNFVFSAALVPANSDTIADFTHADDTIKLENGIFKGMGSGALQSKYFFAGAHAHDANDRIIYNKATGALYYDSDGTGAHAQVLFATVANHAHAGIAVNDFLLI
jgi:serralysin